MNLKRLTDPKYQGQISGEGTNESDVKVVRPAILVHSGPNGKVITFMSADGEISFDDARIQNIVKNQNSLIKKLSKGYGGLDKMPIGAFPPILDSHENDSNDRIRGRLASHLWYERRDVPGVGKNVSCVMGKVTFLGKDTVDRVKDGRIYHLSIGIDESTDTLSELSTVIKPAACGAMLLKQGKNKMPTKKLNVIKEEIKKMRSSMGTSTELMRLTQRKGVVTAKLIGLMKEGKLTPAEYKKLNIKELASLKDEVFTMAIKPLEALERKVMPGQLGSTDAPDFSEIGSKLEERQFKTLKSEIKGEIKKLSGGGVKFKNEDEDPAIDKDHKMEGMHNEVEPEKKPEVKDADNKFAEPTGSMKEHADHLKKLGCHLAEGNIEEAKKAHEEMMKHFEAMNPEEKHLSMYDVKSEDYQKSMEDLQKQIDELNTQMGRIAGMIDEITEVEHEEGEEDIESGKKTEEIGEKHKGLTQEEAAKKLEEETKKFDEKEKAEALKKLEEAGKKVDDKGVTEEDKNKKA